MLEAVSDPAGSRMLWYYLDDGQFVVSNSERAITMYVGRFDFEPAVVPWLVSTGTRGPGLSYSRHLRLIPPSGTARLDKAAWTLTVNAPPIRFAEVPRDREAHLAALEAALSETFATFGEADAEHAILALSGGTDSRALAAFLSRPPGHRWRSFTGGTTEAAGLGKAMSPSAPGSPPPSASSIATSPPAPPPPSRSKPCSSDSSLPARGATTTSTASTPAMAPMASSTRAAST